MLEYEDALDETFEDAVFEPDAAEKQDLIYVDDIAVRPKDEVLTANNWNETAVYATEYSFVLLENETVKYEQENEPYVNTSAKCSQNINYTCETCQEVFETQTNYRQHIKQHGAERFLCIQCNKWFPTKTRLRMHEQCHINNVEKHKCDLCDSSYRIKSNLIRHMRTVHDQKRLYVCLICNETFGRPDVLKKHKLTHTEERLFKCNNCEACFKSRRYLESHMRTHQPKTGNTPKKKSIKKVTDPDQKKTYQCAHCGKISDHIFTHKNHLRTHTEERPHKCETCTKSFRTIAALMAHERIHNDLRPYQCEHCLVSFRQHAHLKDHILIHTGKLPYVCQICSSAFTKKCNLNRHMKTHTAEKLLSLSEEPDDLMHYNTGSLTTTDSIDEETNAEAEYDEESVLQAEPHANSTLFAKKLKSMELIIDENDKFSSLFIMDDIT